MKDLKWWQWLLLMIIIILVLNTIIRLVMIKKAKNVDDLKDFYGFPVSDKDEQKSDKYEKNIDIIYN